MYPDPENVNKKPLSRLSYRCDYAVCAVYSKCYSVCCAVQSLICLLPYTYYRYSDYDNMW